MRKLGLIIGLSVAALLSACGGGGGSSGDTHEAYSITLRADKKQLPINIAHTGAGIGAYAPYTTTLYVEAREGSKPIPGGEDIFSCNIVQGFESGALYYLDGDDEHEDDDGNPLAYRSVVLGSNSGAATFHFHASNKAGTARVMCSVTNPRDNQVSSAAVDIVVGASTGMPASVNAIAQQPGYLGSQFNPNSIRNNVGIQAFVMDDANQPIPNPAGGAPNLQVRIVPTAASEGARIMAGSQPYINLLHISTNGGVGLLSLSSGPNKGVILLEFMTDRYDNNVSNGIQDSVVQLMAVPVVDAVAQTPLTIADAELSATNGVPYAYALQAEGGVPPYTWTALGGLPSGLTLNPSGVISGTPKAPAGDYTVAVQVTDATGKPVTANLTLTLGGAMPLDPLAIVGCTGAINEPCKLLPNAEKGKLYTYILSTSGGDSAQVPAWTFTPPGPTNGLTFAGTGIIHGTPAACGVHTFVASVKQGTLTVTRQMSIEVVGTTASPCP